MIVVFVFVVRITGFVENLSLDGIVGINPIAFVVFAVLMVSLRLLEL
jgi:hypothetical protein